jgi:rhodanese-related sulfurtransferase
MPTGFPNTKEHPMAEAADAPDAGFQRLRPDQVLAWLATRPDALVLDAREARHHAISHLAGCTLLGRHNQDALLRARPRTRPVLIYCYHGNASQTWASMFGDFGFSDVADLVGGWAAIDRQGALHGPQPLADVLPRPAPVASSVPPALAAWLAAEGFDATQPGAPAQHGNTPLMHAAWRGAADRVEALLAFGVALDAANHDGNNALWLASVHGEPSLIRRLVAAGVPLDHANLVGATALMYAASSGKHTVVATLLELGANPYLQSQDDYTALDMVASRECLQLLRAAKEAPTVAHSVSLPAPRGGRVSTWGGPAAKQAPTAAHAASLPAPPKGLP